MSGIGSFAIGISPIGSIPAFDPVQTVISQFGNSPRTLAIIADFDEVVDPTQNLDAFFDLIWNVDTAQSYGLDVWGRIVGVGRVLQVPQGRFFGFEEQAGTTDPFNVSPFYAGAGSTGNFYLSNDAFRLLIFAKAFANISDGSAKSINVILRTLFGTTRGNAYVVDNHDMTMTYTFEFALTPVELAIIQQSGVLPRTTGVAATVSVI